MRIFLSCLQAQRRHAIPAYQYWEGYFKHGVTEAGAEWIEAPEVDWAEGLLDEDPVRVAAWREHAWPRVVDYLRREHRRRPVDLFVAYLYPRMVDVDAVAEIRRLGIPTVNFFCDNVREFERVPAAFRAFDLNWVPELQAVRMYAREAVPHIHAAMPTWIPPVQRSCDHREEFGVSFIGSRDRLRERLLSEAIQLGLDIELRGAGWPLAAAPVAARAVGAATATSWRGLAHNQIAFARRYGVTGLYRKMSERLQRPVDDRIFVPHVRPRPDQDEYVRITQQSQVTVGVNRYPSYRLPLNRPGTYSRGRDIEAPMMGACYLTEWTAELETMYEIGREIETYRTAEELVERAEMLRRDPARRRELRRRGQQRALTSHSVPRTIERIAERFGIAFSQAPASATTRARS